MYKIDYKGKYFMLQDEDIPLDDMDFVIGKMTKEQITEGFLRNHVENCNYYGIPAYIGYDKMLKARIEAIEDEINKR